MEKKYYALKLVPCRPTFAQDMTAEERNIMQQHVAYWKQYLDNGVAVIYGPVLDSKGTYGLGIVAVNDVTQVEELIKNDPAATINTYEFYPMLAVVPPNQ